MDEVKVFFFNGNVEIVPVNRVFSGFVFHCKLIFWRSAGKFTGIDGARRNQRRRGEGGDCLTRLRPGRELLLPDVSELAAGVR